MKFQLASDLHLEAFEDPSHELHDDDFSWMIQPVAPILILAGDIASHSCPFLPHFLHYVSNHFEHILWVLGNHEYYDSPQTKTPMHIIKQKLIDMCPQNVHILDNQSIEIHDCLFIGSTLWSHIPEKRALEVRSTINDYKYIYQQNNMLITPFDVNLWHEESKQFIIETIKENIRKYEQIIIISHHAPSQNETSHPKHDATNIGCAFASDINLNTFSATPKLIWCCGHTHFNFLYKNHPFGYTLLSNQLGRCGQHEGRLYRNDMTFDTTLR